MSGLPKDVNTRAADLQTWLCGRDIKLPSTPDKVISAIRVHLQQAKQRGVIRNDRDEITKKLIKKNDPISAELYNRLKLDKEQHPPEQVISIMGGEKDLKHKKQGLFFERSDRAWFDFSLTLHRAGEQQLTLLAYDFEIRVQDPTDPTKLSFLRLDLNPPSNRRFDGMRCHLHANTDDEGLAVPAPLLSPLEILDLFVYSMKLRRDARHPRLEWPHLLANTPAEVCER